MEGLVFIVLIVELEDNVWVDGIIVGTVCDGVLVEEGEILFNEELVRLLLDLVYNPYMEKISSKKCTCLQIITVEST